MEPNSPGSSCWLNDCGWNRRTKEWGPCGPHSFRFLRKLMSLQSAGLGRRGEPAGGLDDLARPDAPGAHSDATRGPTYHRPDPLQVGVPASVRLVVGVAEVVPEERPLATDFTHIEKICFFSCLGFSFELRYSWFTPPLPFIANTSSKSPLFCSGYASPC